MVVVPNEWPPKGIDVKGFNLLAPQCIMDVFDHPQCHKRPSVT
jgi:hypothetical protein